MRLKLSSFDGIMEWGGVRHALCLSKLQKWELITCTKAQCCTPVVPKYPLCIGNGLAAGSENSGPGKNLISLLLYREKK